MMLRSVSERSETDSTTPWTFRTSIATVSPIRNQPSKNISRPAITSIRNRCAAKPITIATNDAPDDRLQPLRAGEDDDREQQRDREREVADRRLDQRDRGLALADARDHAGVELLAPPRRRRSLRSTKNAATRTAIRPTSHASTKSPTMITTIASGRPSGVFLLQHVDQALQRPRWSSNHAWIRAQ